MSPRRRRSTPFGQAPLLVGLLVEFALSSAACDIVNEVPVDYGPLRTHPGTPLADPDPRDPFLAVTAPDRTTIRLDLSWLPPDGIAGEIDRYTITGSHGDLEILDIEVDDDASVWLTTTEQKLGVSYTIDFDASTYRILETFPSADNVTLWAAAIGDPNVSQIEVQAERVAIGEHVVIYVEQGMEIGNAEEAIAFFDHQIFPIETSLFNDAPDRDDNGRILLLGVDGGATFGGYFSVVNSVTDAEALEQWGRHSNEMEMLYINVSGGELDTETIVAHEFAHLLYNESHDPNEDWAYHNEGLAECAVHAVNGSHPRALKHYQSDPTYTIRDGLSLVKWSYGNYPQYAQAYVFWSYVAGQLGGVEGFGELFSVNGAPEDVEAFFAQELGMSFGEAQLNALIATWVQAPSGVRGFNSLLKLTDKPQHATTNTLELAPFAGAFLVPDSPVMDYPGSQGADVVFAGISGSGEVDLEAPFDVEGGTLVVLNTSSQVDDPVSQPTGLLPYDAAIDEPTIFAERDPGWLHPPPFDPRHMERTWAWQKRTGALTAAGHTSE